ncbi:hypothetical protein G647_04864 [Cladophialophora carrionii CBS 160.54]|uniref:Uncharacterized protein n=1 Tax=Cladophialophora carrionii CBS 160.54 TaxID=1279043 RepID=V9D9U3_9EURO|nr:uncharacterized protein G647_04864 [Cladophialophora carrionii CBS 160.54]ETI23068.1 hypothetical protein G647_04864 [Cladophialophora carrionii CBS 160.54]
MPPIKVPPGRDADRDTDADAPRLEIDEEGVARAVFPKQTNKRHFVTDNETARLATDEHGVAQTESPNSNKKKFHLGPIHPAMTGLHLRVGRHRESYARTKLVEPASSAEPGEGPTVLDNDEMVGEETEENIVPRVAPVAARQIVDVEAEGTEEEMVVAGRAAVALGIENAQEPAVGAAILNAPDLPPVFTPWEFTASPWPPVDEIADEELARRYPALRGSEILHLLARGAANRDPDLPQLLDHGPAEIPVMTVHENAEEAFAGWVSVPQGPGALPLIIPWRPIALPFHPAYPGYVQPQLGQFGQWEQSHHEQFLEEQYRREARAQDRENIPLLPPVVFMQVADARTRVRSGSTILTIKGEKFVRVDDTHLLYAVNAEYLLGGTNTTIRRYQCGDWPSHVPSVANERAVRPAVLFELYPTGQYAYTAENGRRKQAPQEFRPQCDVFGRVLLNAHDRPLKFSKSIPYKVSTEIEGWEMEALCRLDADLCNQDFLDRMLPNTVVGGSGRGRGRPSRGTLNNRRRRDRMRLRILPWPVPHDLSYSDQRLIKELDNWEIQENSTMRLRDLMKDEIHMHEAIMYGGHFERSGTHHALHDQARLEQLWVNLRLVRTKFAEDSDEVQLVKDRVVRLLQKMGREDDAAIWDVGTQS